MQPDDSEVGPDEAAVTAAAQRLGHHLRQLGLMVSTVESCTGGLIARALTETAGSSAWFDRGFVTYSNAAKIEMVGVSPGTLDACGAVSEPTAREMAVGGLRNSAAAIALAVTGIAGPGGATPGKPVGTGCFAWAHRDGRVLSQTLHLPGDRSAVRRSTALHALAEAWLQLSDQSKDRLFIQWFYAILFSSNSR